LDTLPSDTLGYRIPWNLWKPLDTPVEPLETLGYPRGTSGNPWIPPWNLWKPLDTPVELLETLGYPRGTSGNPWIPPWNLWKPLDTPVEPLETLGTFGNLGNDNGTLYSLCLTSCFVTQSAPSHPPLEALETPENP
jgi:hypothetical protein